MAKFQAGNTFGKGRPSKAAMQEKLNKFIEDVASEALLIVAEKISEDMKSKAVMSTHAFYDDYTPRSYKRTMNLRDKSYSKVIRRTGNVIETGITFSPEEMEEVYKNKRKNGVDKEFVFDLAFYSGYHGLNYGKVSFGVNGEDDDEYDNSGLFGFYPTAARTRSIKSYMDAEYIAIKKTYNFKMDKIMKDSTISAIKKVSKK